ncbi:MAG: hypothetical protein IPL36_02100 [Nigerium sp.]|nr:hypothetical protein [Nigerium sp.]
MKRLGIAAVLALFPLVACSPEPRAFTASGTLILAQASFVSDISAPCEGKDGYADIRRGAQVKISDGSGKVIAIGALGAGKGSSVGNVGAYNRQAITHCTFVFEVKDVPAGEAIYGVEVSRRGVINFTAENADMIALTLG